WQQWKASSGWYRDNPEKVANLVDRAIKTQNPDWGDLNAMLETLLDDIREKLQKMVEMRDTVVLWLQNKGVSVELQF
ncbi:hypothetical protein IHE44_0004800, partial [Lamprotornis superbus]